MEKWCVDCGQKYEYDSCNPLGATSWSCPACQKRNSRFKKKIKLMLIAGNNALRCRACGYSKYPYALTMIQATDPLFKITPEQQAKESYLLCLNCEAALNSGDLTVKVLDAKSYPVKLSIFDTKVKIEESPIDQYITSNDAMELEVVEDEKEIGELRSVSRTIRRLASADAEEV